MNKYFSVLMFLFTIVKAYGQTYSKFDVTNSGIYNNYIQACCEDKNGNLWFGTRDGISMYNGNDWVQFNSGNSVVSGTIGKLIAYDNEIFAINNYNNASLPPKSLSKTGTVYKYDGTSWKVFLESSTETFTDIAIDVNKTAWVTTIPNGLIKFDGKQVEYINRTKNKLPCDSLWCIQIDNLGSKWLGTWKNGLVKYTDSVVSNYKSGPGALCNEFVRCLYFDKQKNHLIIGSWENCITRYNINNNSFEGFGAGNSGYNLPKLEAITEYGGRYWFASQGNGGLSWDGKYSWLAYSPTAYVFSLTPYRKRQQIVFGTAVGAFLYDLPNAGNQNFQMNEVTTFNLNDNNVMNFIETNQVKNIDILNLNGQLIYHLNSSTAIVTLNLSFLKSGYYIAKIENRSQLILIK
jgi:ligand-binding sensor domain-containing protein